MTDSKKTNFLIFLSAFLILFIFSCVCGIYYGHLYYDADLYWNLGKSYVVGGQFSFTNITQAWRGYLLPLIYCVANWVGITFNHSGIIGFRLISSLIYAALFSLLLPRVIEAVSGKKNKRIYCLIPLVLSLVFWYGLFIYPLSDVIAITFNFSLLLVAVRLIKHMNSDEQIQNISIRSGLLWYSVLFGFLAYSTYNIRTIYQFSGILAFLIIIWLSYKKTKNIKLILILTLSIIFGVLVASIPQIIINFNVIHKFSMRVPIDSLLSNQLYWGMYVQRYDTNIGTNYPNPGVLFLDPVGQAIIAKEGIKNFFSIFHWMKLVIKYPLDFVGMYTRHFFNALLPVFPETYISNIYLPQKVLLMLLNYLILYFSALSIYVEHRIKKENVPSKKINSKDKSYIKQLKDTEIIKYNKILAFIIILIPCIAILPGAIEIRFFFAAYLIIYGYLAFAFPWKETKLYLQNHKFANIIVLVIGFAVCCSVWGNTFVNLQYAKLFLN